MTEDEFRKHVVSEAASLRVIITAQMKAMRMMADHVHELTKATRDLKSGITTGRVAGLPAW